MEKMKICQILGGNEDGGLEKHTIELSKQLKNRGMDVSVIAHRDFASSFENVDFIPLDLSKSRNNPLILLQLFRKITEGRFDIIHTQANKSTAMISKLSPFINSKVVSTLHNYKRSLSPFYKSDFVITVSDKIGENLDVRHKKTVYNGIEFAQVPEGDRHILEKYGIPPDKFTLCSVARFTKVKRFELLIESMINIDAHLVLVGSGDEEQKLKQLVKRFGVESKVTFPGNLPNEHVKHIIKLASLFVMCSDNEGFPYTFVETMFCKTPFISTPVSDMEKLLGSKYILPFGEAEAISEKVSYIQSNYADVMQDFKKIFDYGEKKFTIDNMVEETIAVYRDVINH